MSFSFFARRCLAVVLGSVVALLVLLVALPTFAIVVRTCNADPMTIQYGDLVNCAIDSVGDTDSFQFSGRPGDHALIQAHSTSAGAAACLVVTDPDSTQVASDCYGAPSGVVLMLAKTGNYTITVNENANNETVDYAVLLQAHPQRPARRTTPRT